MILTGKVSIFQRIKNWFVRLRLRRRGIDFSDLKINIKIVNFLEKNPRYCSSLDPDVLVNDDLGFTSDFLRSVFLEFDK